MVICSLVTDCIVVLKLLRLKYYFCINFCSDFTCQRLDISVYMNTVYIGVDCRKISNILLQAKSKQKVIVNWFCTPIVLVFNVNSIFLMERQFLFEFLKIIGV